MISPLTKDLIAGAIGESGSLEDLDLTLAQGEQTGLEIARQLGADTLAALRALPAERISAFQQAHGDPTGPTVDGYFFPRPPREILAAGEQARVPLLVGSNSEESAADAVLESAAPTLANYHAALSRLYGANANAVFAAYPASGDGDPVTLAARELANDRFIGANTWNWIDAATRTGGRNTYYYYFDQPRPPVRDGVVSPYGADWRSPRGAMHSAEIEYALGNLPGNTIYAWTDTDRAVSELMQGYFVNFVKKGDPNGEGLPAWGTYASGQRMIIAGTSRSEADASRARYQIMSQLPR
jgi:para-nitrobenzyl esterase